MPDTLLRVVHWLLVSMITIECGCGRIAFDQASSPDAGNPDTSLTLTIIEIEAAPHHMGDTSGGGIPFEPEGATWRGSFTVLAACVASTIEIDFAPPWGPNATPNEPYLALNGLRLGSIAPFFQGCTISDCDSFPNGPVRVSLASDVRDGVNMLELTGAVDDDYFWSNATLNCWR